MNELPSWLQGIIVIAGIVVFYALCNLLSGGGSCDTD